LTEPAVPRLRQTAVFTSRRARVAFGRAMPRPVHAPFHKNASEPVLGCGAQGLEVREDAMRRTRLIRLLLILSASGAASSAMAADWLQFGYDQAHSGFNTAERGYLVGNTSSAQWSVTIHAFGSATALSTNSTPVYLSNVVTASGTKDLLFLVTQNGTIVAFSASDGSVVWSNHPTASGGSPTTGSAAIDPNRQFVYAYALDGNLHKYQVDNGHEVQKDNTPVGKLDGWPEIATKKPDVEKGAAGIAIATPPGGVTYLYHAMNGYGGDGGDYQGHVTIVNLSTDNQTVFNAMCSNIFAHFSSNGTPRVDDCNLGTTTGSGPGGRDGQMSGIWGRPGVIYDAPTNRIYFATGNGLFDANTAGDYEWGDSVLSLHPDGTGSGMGMPYDSYTPSNFAGLYNGDTDLGSTAPAILPSTHVSYPHLAIQSGKDGCVRLINLDNMSGAGGPGHAGGELNAGACSSPPTGQAIGGTVFPQPAVWVNPADGTTWAFVANNSAKLNGYKLDVSGSVPALVWQWTNTSGGTSPAIANGVLFAGANGIVRGFNPTTGAQVWSASIGSLNWQTPIVVSGHLYIADSNSKLWSFAFDGIFKHGYE